MKQVLFTTVVVTAITGSFAPAKVHAQSGVVSYPGNEAVRVVNGKRVVEQPPLTERTQRFLRAGNKLPAPVPGSEVFMIEGPDGLRECSSAALTESSCVAPTIGATKLRRFWTVKLNGVWLNCPSRKGPTHCERADTGRPGGMGEVE
jgi:hypothetical protein